MLPQLHAAGAGNAADHKFWGKKRRPLATQINLGSVTMSAPIANAPVPGNIEVPDGQTQTIKTLIDIQGTASASHRVSYVSANDNASPFIIEGASGSLRAQGGILMGPNTTILIDETTAYTGVAGGRIGDSTPLQLSSARLSYANSFSPARNLSETIGPLGIAGFSTITFVPSGASNGQGSTTLIAERLDRINRGTLEILPILTLGSAGTSSGYVRLNTAPATTDGGVVPYVTAKLDSGTDGYGVVVYEAANGLRLLSSSEYTTTLAAATPESHLRVPNGSSLTNTEDITVRTLNLGSGSTVLNGGGSITLTSGLLLYPGGSGEKVDNSIRFGAQEGLIAMPVSPFSGVLEFLKPVTGSAGLTIYGNGTTSFAGGNQVSGTLTLNGSVKIMVSSPADLGPDSSTIQINGRDTGAGIRLRGGTLDLTRPVQVNSGYFATLVPNAGSVLTLSGGISGPGGLYITSASIIGPDPGYTLLTGTNTYTGPTTVAGTLALSSDAALGNTSAIVMSTGAVKMLGDWTTARRFDGSNLSSSMLTIDTNGHDFDFKGTLGTAGFAPYFTKTGEGTFYISVPADNTTSKFRVAHGDLIMRANARLKADPIEVNSGGRFIIDNRTQVSPRGTLNVNAGGGEYIVLGHATQPTIIQGSLGLTADSNYGPPAVASYSTTTLSAPGSAPVTLDLNWLDVSTGLYLLVRGDNLAGAAGTAYTRVRAATVPTEKNGVLPQIIIDTSSTGTGQTFAKYDKSSDAAGVIGLRALRPNEMTSTALIANPANGGTTATTANFLATGNVSTVGDRNSISTLTMDAGSRLSINSTKGLSITQDVILLRAGATSEITGNALPATSGYLWLVGGGDLRLGVALGFSNELRHLGPGTLEVVAQQARSRFVFANGTLRIGTGDPMTKTDLFLQEAAQLDLGDRSTRLGSLAGNGTVALAGGELTIVGGVGPSPRVFSGTLTGSGTFTSAASDGITLSGNSPFTGRLAVKGGTLTVSGPMTGVKDVAVNNGGFLILDYSGAVDGEPRLGQIPVDVSSGVITLINRSTANTAASLGALTANGLTRLVIDNDSNTTPGTDGLLTFASLERRDRGGFIFTPQIVAGRTARFDVTADLTGSLIGDPATATAHPILPYATYSERTATFEPGVGVRALTASEQVSTITPGQNVRLTTNQTPTGRTTINSLELATGGSIIGSTGTLQITSGFVLAGGPIDANLDFGTVEGHIFTKSVVQNAQVSGKISGSNGLTISGLYPFSLLGANDFTGPLTINGATVNFTSSTALGADKSPVELAGGTLQYNGPSTTFTRDLDLLASGGTFYTPSATVSLQGKITGPSSLKLAGTITLTNTENSYAGPTTIAGSLTFASDAVFGQSPLLRTLSSTTSSLTTLTLKGNWTTARALEIENTSLRLDTGVYDAVLSGSISGSRQFNKAGSGSVTINEAATFTGGMSIESGTARLNSNLGTSSTTPQISVSAGARLEAQASVPHKISMAGTLAPGIGIGTLESGDLTFSGGARLELQLADANTFDQLRVNGAVTFNGLVQLALDVPFTVPFSSSWPILLNDGADAITTSSSAAFAMGSKVLTEGTTFFLNGQEVHISYKAGDGNDIYILVPEPSTAGCIAAGAACLLARVRRRRA